MPRYFFDVVYTDGAEIRHLEGTRLRSDNVVIETARQVIDDLRAGRRPEDPEPTIIVKNVAGELFIASLAINSCAMATPRMLAACRKAANHKGD